MEDHVYEAIDSAGHPSADEVRQRLGSTVNQKSSRVPARQTADRFLHSSRSLIRQRLEEVRELKDVRVRAREYKKFKKALLDHLSKSMTLQMIDPKNRGAKLSDADQEELKAAMTYAKKALNKLFAKTHASISSKKARARAKANKASTANNPDASSPPKLTIVESADAA